MRSLAPFCFLFCCAAHADTSLQSILPELSQSYAKMEANSVLLAGSGPFQKAVDKHLGDADVMPKSPDVRVRMAVTRARLDMVAAKQTILKYQTLQQAIEANHLKINPQAAAKLSGILGSLSSYDDDCRKEIIAFAIGHPALAGQLAEELARNLNNADLTNSLAVSKAILQVGKR